MRTRATSKGMARLGQVSEDGARRESGTRSPLSRILQLVLPVLAVLVMGLGSNAGVAHAPPSAAASSSLNLMSTTCPGGSDSYISGATCVYYDSAQMSSDGYGNNIYVQVWAYLTNDGSTLFWRMDAHLNSGGGWVLWGNYPWWSVYDCAGCGTPISANNGFGTPGAITTFTPDNTVNEGSAGTLTVGLGLSGKAQYGGSGVDGGINVAWQINYPEMQIYPMQMTQNIAEYGWVDNQGLNGNAPTSGTQSDGVAEWSQQGTSDSINSWTDGYYEYYFWGIDTVVHDHWHQWWPGPYVN